MTANTTTAPKPTKADLIATLVERGHGRAGLNRLTLAGLTAMLDEDAPQPEKPAGPTPAPVADSPAPVLSGDLLLAVEDVLPGDIVFGKTVSETSRGPKWSWLASAPDKKGDKPVWWAQLATGTVIPVLRPESI